ncbi:MAG: hypothetical protein Ct9H300mP14_04660 [Gammaproteobacteria bacterium]|nr:MAG: hypothetical protein Ct9H300mP14_04660 [Gammaproteobacteria bacterium]
MVDCSWIGGLFSRKRAILLISRWMLIRNVVEWRALTVALLDEMVVRVRRQLAVNEETSHWPACFRGAVGQPAAAWLSSFAQMARRPATAHDGHRVLE